MSETSCIGRVHSFQSMGTVDGPGVRYVVFLQGCNLRCGCCHNPDTWEACGGTEYTAADIASRIVRYKEYFGSEGGVTVSGGEPLLQADFVRELFRLCHENGINTCLDTSGSVLGASVDALLCETDRILLDIKFATDEEYRSHVGCGMEKPLAFLSLANKANIPVTLRQVVIPTLNDNAQSISALASIASAHPCVDKIELLPFRKICQVKYDNMQIPFKFGHLPEPSAAVMAELNARLLAEWNR
ncbi:MAG: pyruvate formate lyase-activating protein [Clostridia bacterium]|nr:pyruvate formate lyase-activating protein [Clostridia bacterium]